MDVDPLGRMLNGATQYMYRYHVSDLTDTDAGAPCAQRRGRCGAGGSGQGNSQDPPKPIVNALDLLTIRLPSVFA